MLLYRFAWNMGIVVAPGPAAGITAGPEADVAVASGSGRDGLAIRVEKSITRSYAC